MAIKETIKLTTYISAGYLLIRVANGIIRWNPDEKLKLITPQNFQDIEVYSERRLAELVLPLSEQFGLQLFHEPAIVLRDKIDRRNKRQKRITAPDLLAIPILDAPPASLVKAGVPMVFLEAKTTQSPREQLNVINAGTPTNVFAHGVNIPTMNKAEEILKGGDHLQAARTLLGTEFVNKLLRLK